MSSSISAARLGQIRSLSGLVSVRNTKHSSAKPQGFYYLFRNLVQSGEECGGSFAVYHNGKLVVDLWGGYADWQTEQPWDNQTVSKWFSVTKAMCAVVVAMLVDRSVPLSPWKPDSSLTRRHSAESERSVYTFVT